MKQRVCCSFAWALMAMSLSTLIASPISAQPVVTEIVRDGTIGLDTSFQPELGPIFSGSSSTAYQIGEELGERHGLNIFHSFERFNPASSDIAQFAQRVRNRCLQVGRTAVRAAEALRRRAFSHPYYWSPYLVISNWL